MTRPAARRPAVYLAGYLAGIFGLLGLGYLGPREPLAVGILLLIIAYGLVRVWLLAAAAPPRWGLLVFWLSSLFILLVPGVVQLSDGAFFWPTWGAYGSDTVTTAALLLGLGTVVVDLSYQIPKETPTKPGRPTVSTVEDARVFGWLCALGVAWSGGVLLALGPGFFLRPRGVVDGALAENFSLPWLGLAVTLGSALLNTLLVLGVRLWLAPCPTVLTAAARRRTGRWLAVIVACGLVINFPGSQARYPLLATLLLTGLVVARQTGAGPMVGRWLAWGFAPLLYGAVRFQGAYNRDSGYDFDGAWRAVLDLKTTLHHGDFDGMQMTIAGVRYAAVQGHTWGQQLLGGVLFFVPRGVWPGKALPTGSLLAGHEAFDYTNLGAPLLLEGWLDFAWPGLVILAVGLGILLRRVDAAAQEPTGHSSLYALAVIAFLPIVLRGALLAVIAPVAAVFFWLWVSDFLAARLADRGSGGGFGD